VLRIINYSHLLVICTINARVCAESTLARRQRAQRPLTEYALAHVTLTLIM